MRNIRRLMLGLLLLSLAGVSWGEEGEFLYEQYLTEDPEPKLKKRIDEPDWSKLVPTQTLTWANGDVYQGQTAGGRPHGQGKMTYASGLVEEGAFKDGIFIPTEADVERKEKQRLAKLERERVAQAKYKRIFNACLLDKSYGLDMQAKSIEAAVNATCEAIATDPSWLESLQYD